MLSGMETRCRPLRRSPRRWTSVALSVASATLLYAAASTDAEAAVRGRNGIEIEGPHDRRGFYIGGGLAFGGTFFYVDDFIPATRAELDFGGGITKRFTLGASLHVTPFLKRGVGTAFGGDVEATGYMWRGLYVRGGLGLAGVPRREEGEDEQGLSMGLGGKAEAGYEFWVSTVTAMSVGVTYDARFIPGSRFPRQTVLIGLRVLRF